MAPRYTTTFLIAAVVALPVALAALPYLRRPTPKPTRPPPTLPAGVERRFTQQGLEILVAKPPSDLPVKQSKPLAPILLLHGEFGTAMVWSRWLPYLASKGRTVYAVSLSGMPHFHLALGEYCVVVSEH
jgi:pimeloyl-ACP methyl ester carboxylesterase